MFIVKHVIKHAQRFKGPSRRKFRTRSTKNNLKPSDMGYCSPLRWLPTHGKVAVASGKEQESDKITMSCFIQVKYKYYENSVIK